MGGGVLQDDRTGRSYGVGTVKEMSENVVKK